VEAYIAEWLHLSLRWFHVITAITWVGSSFYFNRIDRSFRPLVPPVERVSGQLWSVHGGAIYNYSRYPVGPGYVPDKLKWSKWESLGTWVSGAGLLAVVYWWGAGINLVSGGADSLGPGAAIAASIASILCGWVIYDILCRLIASDKVLSLVIAALISASVWGFMHLFSGKAAYLHAGIVMATIMAGNVWFVILPGQKRMLQAIKDGTIDGFDVSADAKRRNYHNNYLTLPVVFAMIAGHFPMTYGNPHGWLGFILISGAGVAIRHFFNTMHAGHAQPRWIAAGIALGVAAMVLLAPPNLLDRQGAISGPGNVDVSRVAAVIHTRCAVCHAQKPTMEGFTEAPKGLVLDSVEKAARNAQKIQQMAIVTNVMPPANLTGMTEGERKLLAQWIEAGAPVK
jgi:uncharacterized membrane protein